MCVCVCVRLSVRADHGLNQHRLVLCAWSVIGPLCLVCDWSIVPVDSWDRVNQQVEQNSRCLQAVDQAGRLH